MACSAGVPLERRRVHWAGVKSGQVAQVIFQVTLVLLPASEPIESKLISRPLLAGTPAALHPPSLAQRG